MTIKISSDNIQANTLAALGSSVPKISAITYPGNDTAADIAGGQTIGVIGTGFVAGANILINGAYVSVVNVVNSTLIQFTAPVLSAGTYTLYVINTDGGTAISIPGISYSGTPTWTTAAGSLASVYEASSISSTVAATGDATVTYSLFSGTLPTSSTLNANSGLISGTAPASSGATTYSFVIRATDGQNQDTDRSFSITINTDVVTWISPANNTTTGLFVDSGTNLPVTLSANSATGRSITFSANSLPAGLSISGNTITGTPTTAQTVNSLITATSSVTNETASQIFNWTVSVANDTYFKNTTALLSGDTFINTTDSSTNNFQVTPVAAPPATNLTPFQNSYSVGFGGGNVLTVPSDASLTIGTASATIELWIYPLTISGYQRVVTATIGGFASGAFVMRFNNGTFLAGDSGGNTINSSTMPILNQWNHIAWVGTSGSTQALYINGVSVGTSTTYNLSTAIQWIGGYYNVGPAEYTTAYISNVRIVKGTAVYTGAFTPPAAPLTAISGTSLLTCQSNYVKDNSTNNFAITNTGAASISQRSPFETTPSVTLGSTSFNGSSQYMTVSSNAAFSFGTGDFTVEGWINLSSATGAYRSILSIPHSSGELTIRFGNSASYGSYFQVSVLSTLVSNVYSTNQTQSALLNQWVHFAFTRSSSTCRVFLNGVLQGIGTGAPATVFSATTFTDSTNITNNATVGIGEAVGVGIPFIGNISNLRIVKGTAVYTANFTPSTSALTSISGTSLLTLQSPVPNNNNTFIDSSPNTFAVTRVGTPTQGSFSPFGSNWSNYFDGTGDYLSIPANAAFQLTGDFTVEAWVNLSVINSFNMLVGNENLSTGTDYFSIRPTRIETSLGAVIGEWDFTPTLNTWYHIAFVRSSNNTKVYVNGSQLTLVAGTATNSAQIFPNGTTLFVGKYGGGSGLPFTGNISNFRLVKGTAVYTANFTPSTSALTSISGTSLLTCQSNNFKDNSTNNFVVTKFGDTNVSRFSPFNTATGYVPSIYGGSMNFSGTGQVLTVTDNDAFEMPGDFTVETWFNMTATPAAFTTLLSKGASGIYQPYYFAFSSNTTLLFYSSSNGTAWDIASAVSLGAVNINTWNHVAVSRSGSSMRLFLNGALITTITSSAALYNNSLAVAVGGRSDTTELFTGYISNTRIVKGTALYTSAFTPSTTPLTAVTNTSLLLSGTNAGVVDQTMQGNYETPANSIIVNSPAKYGTGSLYCNNTSTVNKVNAPAIRTGNFTVECWYYSTSTTSAYRQIIIIGNLNMRFGDSGFGDKLQVTLGTTVGVVYSCSLTSAAAINAWYHFAFTRESGVCKLWVNGVQQSLGAGANPGSYPSTSFTDAADLTSTTQLIGYAAAPYYLDDVRITNGVARYTANFTPSTTALFTK